MITDFLDKVFCEDCNDLMDKMQDDCIDLTVTSPPYGKLRLYNGFSFNFETAARNLWRITKIGGILVWVVGDQTKNGSESGDSFRQVLYFMSLGFRLHDTMIYAKKNYIPQTHNRYEQEFEYMFVFTKEKPKTFNPILVPSKTAGQTMKLARKGYGFKEGSFRRRDAEVTTGEFRRPGNIFYYTCGNSGKNHEAVFPAQLAADHIRSWSNPLDIVFDPFGGSGTTAEQAKLLGRYYITCDISKQYVEDIEERLSKTESIIELLTNKNYGYSNNKT